MTSDTAQSPIARIERVALQTEQLERLRDFYACRLGAQASPVYQEPDAGRRPCSSTSAASGSS
jgi:hypothetical protein